MSFRTFGLLVSEIVSNGVINRSETFETFSCVMGMFGFDVLCRWLWP